MSQMNPKEFIYNTTYSVLTTLHNQSLPFRTGKKWRQKHPNVRTKFCKDSKNGVLSNKEEGYNIKIILKT